MQTRQTTEPEQQQYTATPPQTGTVAASTATRNASVSPQTNPVPATTRRKRRKFLTRLRRRARVVGWQLTHTATYSRWKVLCMFVAAVVAALLCGKFLQGWGALWHKLETTQVEGKPVLFILAPPILTVGGGLIAGAITLWQYNRGHRQRDEHLLRTQRQSQRLAEQKERQERLHFARKELQDQFTDIQNRLEKDSPFVRANAALRLADFATRLDPAKEPTDDRTPRPPRNAKNNPYFVQVASLLANALYLEPEDAVRRSIGEALGGMTEFARDSENAALLYILVEKLVNVNHAAKAQFVQALATWAASGSMRLKSKDTVSDEDIELAATVTGFCAKQKQTIACLRSLMEEGQQRDAKTGAVINLSDYMVQYTMAVGQRKAVPAWTEQQEQQENVKTAPEEVPESHGLPILERTAKQLKDTRDALSGALRALPVSDAYPKEAVEADQAAVVTAVEKLQGSHTSNVLKEYLKEIEKAVKALSQRIRDFTPQPALKLQQCFLAGADLREADLQGADLREADLQGADLSLAHLQDANLSLADLQDANLRLADLQGADLSLAHLQGADLREADLQGAYLSLAHLQGADLSLAHLQGADLRWAHLQGADLRWAHLQGAYLSLAHLQGAYLSLAHLQGANLSRAQLHNTKLYGGIVEKEGTADSKKTDFSGSAWTKAVNISPELRLWLEQFPVMPDEKVIPFSQPENLDKI